MRTAVAMLLGTLANGAGAAEHYFDYATVSAAEPIYESVEVPHRREVCEPVRDVAPPGDVRRSNRRVSIGEAIEADDERRRPRCRTVETTRLEKKITGWRVTYRYGGRTWVERFRHKPGERIRVRVDLDID